MRGYPSDRTETAPPTPASSFSAPGRAERRAPVRPLAAPARGSQAGRGSRRPPCAPGGRSQRRSEDTRDASLRIRVCATLLLSPSSPRPSVRRLASSVRRICGRSRRCARNQSAQNPIVCGPAKGFGHRGQIRSILKHELRVQAESACPGGGRAGPKSPLKGLSLDLAGQSEISAARPLST